MMRVLQTIRSRRGLALVTVLWVTMLMIVLVSVTSQSALLDTHISHVNVERQRCRWACRAGIETAIAVLDSEDKGYDALTDDWGTSSDYLTELEFEGCTVEVTVTDTASKLNLNTVTKNQLLCLPDMTEEIADSILDWRDNNGDVRVLGAEDGYYMNLDIGYRPQNAAFKTNRELLRVRGVSEGLYYGDPELELISEENEGWRNYLTYISIEPNIGLDGESKLNINNASESQLQQTLSVTPAQARWIVQNRQFNNYSDLLRGNSRNSGNRNQRRSGNNNNNQQEDESSPPDQATALSIIDYVALNNQRFNTGRVNINTAEVVVLTAILEGNRELAEGIVAYRDGMAGGFASMSDLQEIEGMTTDALRTLVDATSIRSCVYEIDCVAYSLATDLQFHVKTIVNREQSEGRILYWREGSSH